LFGRNKPIKTWSKYSPIGRPCQKTVLAFKHSGFLKKIDLIMLFPRTVRIVPEMGHERIREQIMGHYRVVYYIVSEQRIDLLMIHNAAISLEMRDFN